MTKIPYIEPRELVTKIRRYYTLPQIAKATGVCERTVALVQVKNTCLFDTYAKLRDFWDKIERQKEQ